MNIQINLLPWREELKEIRKKEFFVVLGSASVGALLIILFVHFLIDRAADAQISNNNLLRQEIVLLDKKIAEIKTIKKEKAQLLARMQVIQQLQMNRPHIVKLFDGITRTIPEGLYLTAMAKNNDRILIDGKAESNSRVSAFMRNIEAYTWLKLPKLSFIQADEKESKDQYIDFNLEAFQVTEEKIKENESKPQ